MGISGKSVDENILPIGTHEEHVKKEADSEWECNLAKIKETMRISGESVDEDIPPIGTPKEHAKIALDSDWEFSLTGSKEGTTGVSEECSNDTGLNHDSNDSQSQTVEGKDESTESSNGSGVPVATPVYPVGTLNAMGGNIEQDEKFSKDCSNSLEQKALESESVNLDETVHSAGIFNSTEKTMEKMKMTLSIVHMVQIEKQLKGNL